MSSSHYVGYIKAVKGVPLKFPAERQKVTDRGKDLIAQMLHIDPAQRMAWDDICKHNVFLEKLKESADIKEAMQRKQNQWKLNVYFQFCSPYQDITRDTDFDPKKSSAEDFFRESRILKSFKCLASTKADPQKKPINIVKPIDPKEEERNRIINEPSAITSKYQPKTNNPISAGEAKNQINPTTSNNNKYPSLYIPPADVKPPNYKSDLKSNIIPPKNTPAEINPSSYKIDNMKSNIIPQKTAEVKMEIETTNSSSDDDEFFDNGDVNDEVIRFQSVRSYFQPKTEASAIRAEKTDFKAVNNIIKNCEEEAARSHESPNRGDELRRLELPSVRGISK